MCLAMLWRIMLVCHVARGNSKPCPSTNVVHGHMYSGLRFSARVSNMVKRYNENLTVQMDDWNSHAYTLNKCCEHGLRLKPSFIEACSEL